MFGREYATHLDILLQSFGEIKEEYKKKINKDNIFIERLKILYVLLFGIPEIGFQIRSDYFKKILKLRLTNKNFKKILDAGCGIGIYSFLLARSFPKGKITGIDIDKSKLKSCENIASELKIKNTEFSYSDVLKLPNINYDLIVNIDVLEHVENYGTALKNFYDALNKSGYLYIHVPQPNQDKKRIFSSFKNWHHEGHIREGISKLDLENVLRKLGFKLILSKETFGFFGKLSWELNHMMLSKSFVLAGIFFPLLYVLAKIDLWNYNKNGLGVAILAKKE
ncbi:MAG: class I SAM-dependent methyltransferase [Candidatus Parcubacteria bacterium]|nr:class I SAM-dependent methyltransferase [Candidatus Parcubacteria bacterium]